MIKKIFHRQHTISDLILQLTELKEKYGDIPFKGSCNVMNKLKIIPGVPDWKLPVIAIWVELHEGL